MTAEKRDAITDMVDDGMAITQACQWVGLGRASYYRKPLDWRVADAAVIDALNEQLKKSPRAGFWKCYKRMRLKG